MYNIGTTIAAVIMVAAVGSVIGLIIAAVQIIVKKIKRRNE
tara:strand:+ start:436 stop:558 length:123 start_codon:yes stop_codon:yes gene_type:complete